MGQMTPYYNLGIANFSLWHLGDEMGCPSGGRLPLGMRKITPKALGFSSCVPFKMGTSMTFIRMACCAADPRYSLGLTLNLACLLESPREL